MSVFQIVKRYTAEDESSNLSCGGNIAYLRLQPGEKILDLGCGRGNETIEAAKVVGNNGFAWGLDLTPRMIDLAMERARSEGVGNTAFILGTMENIPLPDNSLDAIISNCAINHVPDKAAVYREIYRLLNSGGRFVVSDIMTEHPLPDDIRNDPEAIAACFGGALTLSEYEAVLSEAGFEHVAIIKERRYDKNGFEMISRTFRGQKNRT